MWLVVGLGNPGSKYARTKHNAGFMALDLCAEKFGASWAEEKNMHIAHAVVDGEKIFFLKPQDFMNLSGIAVQHVSHFYKIPPDHIMVLHDDLDFPLGVVKAQFDRSAAGHNGILDIIEKTGTQAFHRIRIGIGPQTDVAEDFVLQPFSAEELSVLKPALDNAVQLLQDTIKP